MSNRYDHLKKVSQDKNATILKHKDGHEIKIHHPSLSPSIREQLEKLPIQNYKDGGEVSGYDDEEEYSSKMPKIEDVVYENRSMQPIPEEKNILQKADAFLFPESSPHSEKQSTPRQEVLEIEPSRDIATSSPASTQSIAPTTVQSQTPSYEKGINEGINSQVAGQTQMAAAQGQLGQDIIAAQKEAANQQQIAHENMLRARAPIEQKSRETEAWLMQNPLNADRYVQKMSTGSKISTLIGLMLGGFNAGRTGGENYAAKYLQDQIDSDLKAQQNEIGNKRGLLQHYQQQGMDAKDAYQMARITNNEILQSTLASAAAKAQTAQAAAGLLNAKGLLAIEKEKLVADQASKNMKAIDRFVPGVGVAGNEKDATKLKEVISRRKNIDAAVDQVSDMIRKKGTYEATGAHNENMNRLVDQIATDMAKLQDPDSVARPGEVELVKRGLVEAGIMQQDSTALDKLKKFKEEVGRRSNIEFETRGMKPPAEVKTMNGIQYQKVPGGWKKI